MCEPTTLALGTLAVSGMSAVSQFRSGQYSKTIAESNAQIADTAARDAVARGDVAASNSRLKGAALEGEQVATTAANGLDTQHGTPLDILADTKLMSEVDAQTIKANAAREAYGYQKQAMDYRLQGELDDSKSRDAAAGTLLGGLASSGSTYYQGTK